MDGVEIDPAVSKAGRKYLGMGDNHALRVHDADARPFLRRTDERYDLIYIDAYHQPYVPFYLATQEFFELVRDRLAPGGIVALNVATVPDDRKPRGGSRRHARDGVPRRAHVAGAPLQSHRHRLQRRSRRAGGEPPRP